MTPGATYRLQLHAGFTFADAARYVPYLAALGVTHLYLSPSLQAAPGSTHGYDVVDPTRLSDALGGDDGFAALAQTARDAGLGLVLDIVPNHMGLISPDNPWWWDVLTHGPDSRFADHLDIAWERRGDGPPQVVVPHLGRELDEELADGDDLRVAHDPSWGDGEAAFRVVYHEHQWPVRPGSLAAADLDPSRPDEVVATLRDDRGRLYSLLLAQHYRLVQWRRANRELNYRRFFDVTTLGALRIEDEQVFDDTHRRVLDLIAAGDLDGLRIDHPDGLYDPTGYFHDLRAAAGDGAWLVIEKILEDGEAPRDWPVDGTVGYEFLNLVLHLHVDGRSSGVLTDLAARFLGRDRADWDGLVEDAKREVLDTLLVAERARLRALLGDAATAAGADVDAATLHAALDEVLVDFPVYRTYLRPGSTDVDDADRHAIEEAVARSRARRPDLSDALDVVEEALLRSLPGDADNDFVLRFQQLTGPLMAKGVEDTVLYRDVRFAGANEVGGHPAELGRDLGAFHHANQLRQRDWPTAMLTTSTHDTKRSEDVRARLAVLSQLPDRWVSTVDDLAELGARHRVRAADAPSRNLEYLAYQTLVGAWPISRDRLVEYLTKAAREQKQQTSWLDIDGRYEDGVARWVDGLFADAEFVGALERFVDEIREAGWLTSLSQTLLKLTSPGVPDTYQGCELWDLSLVDPDNRRPVDLDLRHQLLAELDADDPRPDELLDRLDDGLPKLWVTRQALHARRDDPAAFGRDATYAPLYADGARADHVAAFVRSGRAITVAPRLVARLGATFATWDWRDTTIQLPDGPWYDRLSGARWQGGRQPLSGLLATFPCALLTKDGP